MKGTEAQSPGSYEVARARCQALGAFPWTFVSCNRLLLEDYRLGSEKFSPQTCYELKRLLKSPSALSSLYTFVRTYYPGRFSRGEIYGPLALAKLLDPLTLAAALSLMYLYKRAKRMCPKDEWAWLAEKWEKGADLGWRVGNALPEIGTGCGMLGEGVLYAALALFLCSRNSPFAQYKRHLIQNKLRFDPAMEHKLFGCTSVQVASLIVTGFGFGSVIAGGFAQGFSAIWGSSSRLAAEAKRFCLLNQWLHVLRDPAKRASLISLKPGSPEELVFKELTARVEASKEEEFPSPWLRKGKDDFQLAEMPGLALEEVESSKVAEAMEEPPPSPPQAEEKGLPVKCSYADLPPELQELVTPEEFKQLEHLPLEQVIALLTG